MLNSTWQISPVSPISQIDSWSLYLLEKEPKKLKTHHIWYAIHYEVCLHKQKTVEIDNWHKGIEN